MFAAISSCDSGPDDHIEHGSRDEHLTRFRQARDLHGDLERRVAGVVTARIPEPTRAFAVAWR